MEKIGVIFQSVSGGKISFANDGLEMRIKRDAKIYNLRICISVIWLKTCKTNSLMCDGNHNL